MPWRTAQFNQKPTAMVSMQKIAILYDASQAVLSAFDLDEVLQHILDIVRNYFQFQNGAVLLLDEETQTLAIRAQFGRHNLSPDFRIPVGEGLTGTAAKLKRPIYSPEVATDPRYIRSDENVRSELSVPLVVRDKVVGVLDFQSERPNYFDAETVDLLTLFSTQASIAIQNARLYASERRRTAQLEAINAIARQTTAVNDLPELLDKLCSLVLEWFAVEHVAVLLLEDDMLHLRADQGRFTRTFDPSVPMKAGSGLSARALASGKPLVESNVQTSEAYVSGFLETRSELCVPLVFFGERLGVMCVESGKQNAFEQGEVQALESVADIGAAAIQNAIHFDRTRKLAYVDGLTGIFNRRHFETRIADELDRALRYNSHLAVVMLDIDHFKRLNDEFGHLLGDEVLRQVSAVLQQQLRKVDVVCRFGGEEFAVLVPETGGANALAVAEKLRRSIASHVFPGVPRPVTISAGVAEFPQNGTTRDELVSAADGALYAAKQEGRNRVVSAGATQSRGAD